MNSKECYIIFYVIAVASIIKQNINIQDPSKVCTQKSFEIVEVVFQSTDKLTITIRGSVECREC